MKFAQIWSLILFLFFLTMCATSVPGALHGEHRFVNSLFAIVGFFSAGLFACNLYPSHMLANDARQSIRGMFVAALALWLTRALLYVVHGMFVKNKLLVAISVLLFAAASRWCWKEWWKKYWKSHHDSMGLADMGQLQYWKAEDFDREFHYARQRFDLATDEKQKKERSLDILALLDVARHYGFVQKREGNSFDTLHFVKSGNDVPSDGIPQVVFGAAESVLVIDDSPERRAWFREQIPWAHIVDGADVAINYIRMQNPLPSVVFLYRDLGHAEDIARCLVEVQFRALLAVVCTDISDVKRITDIMEKTRAVTVMRVWGAFQIKVMDLGSNLRTKENDDVRSKELDHFSVIEGDMPLDEQPASPTLADTPVPEIADNPGITDNLSGLYNARYLNFMLDTEIYRSEQYGWIFSLVALDLKGCPACAKSNSRFLCAIAEKIKAASRLIDVGFRYVDCEFLLLLPQMSKEEACRVTRNLHKSITGETWSSYGIPNSALAACLGVVTYPDDGKTKAELLHSLDETKFFGKNSIHDGAARTRILVVSTEEAGNKAYAEWLCRNGYDAVGCDVIRRGKWTVQEVVEDARTFQPQVALLFHNLRFTKEMTGLDLALLLFESLPNTRFIVGRFGDSYCVSDETLHEAQSRGYEFDTFVIAPEGDNLLEVLEGQKVKRD